MYQKGKTVLMMIVVSIKCRTIYDVPRFEVYRLVGWLAVHTQNCIWSGGFVKVWSLKRKCACALWTQRNLQTTPTFCWYKGIVSKKDTAVWYWLIWQFCVKQELTVVHWHGKMILKWATHSGNYCPDKQRAHSSYWSYVGKMLREQYHAWVDLSQACLEMKAYLELVETVNLVQPTLKTSCHTSESSSRCSKEWIRRCSEEGVSMNPRDKGTEKPKQSPAHNGGTWFLFHFWRDNHESNNLWIEFAAISPVAQLFEKEFLATICWSTGRGRTTLVNECQVWVPPSPSPKSSCNEAEKHWTWWVRLPKRVLRCAQI